MSKTFDIDDVFQESRTWESRLTPDAAAFLEQVMERANETGLRPVSARLYRRLKYEFGVDVSQSSVQKWVAKQMGEGDV